MAYKLTRPARTDGETISHPDLEFKETVKGSRPGDRYVRIATHKGFKRVRHGYLVPRPGTGLRNAGFAAKGAAAGVPRVPDVLPKPARDVPTPVRGVLLPAVGIFPTTNRALRRVHRSG